LVNRTRKNYENVKPYSQEFTDLSVELSASIIRAVLYEINPKETHSIVTAVSILNPTW
jgi:hypothetical protein